MEHHLLAWHQPSDSLSDSASEIQRPRPDLPTHEAQAPVTPRLVALGRIPPEPWAGGAFSLLELKALSWVATGFSHRHRVSEDHHSLWATGRRSTAGAMPQEPSCREGGRGLASGRLPPTHCRPSLPPSPLLKGQEHLAAGLAPGGVSGGGASFRQAQTLLWCKAHQSRLQGWLVLGGSRLLPSPSPDIPAKWNLFSCPFMRAHRALPSPACVFKPPGPAFSWGKGFPRGTWRSTLTLTSASHPASPACPWLCSDLAKHFTPGVLCVHTCERAPSSSPCEQMRKLRLREVESPVQIHKAWRW